MVVTVAPFRLHIMLLWASRLLRLRSNSSYSPAGNHRRVRHCNCGVFWRTSKGTRNMAYCQDSVCIFAVVVLVAVIFCQAAIHYHVLGAVGPRQRAQLLICGMMRCFIHVVHSKSMQIEAPSHWNVKYLWCIPNSTRKQFDFYLPIRTILMRRFFHYVCICTFSNVHGVYDVVVYGDSAPCVGHMGLLLLSVSLFTSHIKIIQFMSTEHRAHVSALWLRSAVVVWALIYMHNTNIRSQTQTQTHTTHGVSDVLFFGGVLSFGRWFCLSTAHRFSNWN